MGRPQEDVAIAEQPQDGIGIAIEAHAAFMEIYLRIIESVDSTMTDLDGARETAVEDVEMAGDFAAGKIDSFGWEAKAFLNLRKEEAKTRINEAKAAALEAIKNATPAQLGFSIDMYAGVAGEDPTQDPGHVPGGGR